eukprot:4831536-Pyramimonas_sp.AAC.1
MRDRKKKRASGAGLVAEATRRCPAQRANSRAPRRVSARASARRKPSLFQRPSCRSRSRGRWGLLP